MTYDGSLYYVAFQWSPISDQYELAYITTQKYNLENFVNRYVPLGALIKGYRWNAHDPELRLIYSNGNWAKKGGVLDE